MKNKKENLPAILYTISAVLFYISAIMAFVSKNTGNGVTNFCLGSTFLALAAVYAKKNHDTETKDKTEENTRESEEQ